jgi:hypothetical protein
MVTLRLITAFIGNWNSAFLARWCQNSMDVCGFETLIRKWVLGMIACLHSVIFNPRIAEY